jgi:phosphatidylserine/phosphatidylglycerophosphate/cardiolipin synthase-like enzyme
MIDTLLSLPPHLRTQLKDGLRAGLIAAPYPSTSVQAATSISGRAAEEVATALTELEKTGLAGAVVAVLLEAVDHAESRSPRPDLVWSGPEVSGLYARDTRRVYEELLGSAERSIWASTYAFFDGPKAFEVLSRRMDSVEDLEVTLLLNIERKWGDTTGRDELVRRFADRFWKTEWPGERRPSVFYDPRSLDEGRPAGVLHAKAVVKDDDTVFITSANLTEAALDRNIELGLVVRDPALSLTVVTHFRGLVERELLSPLPDS